MKADYNHAKTEFVRKWDRFIFTEVLSFGSSPQPARCGNYRCCQQIDLSASVTNELSAFVLTLKQSRRTESDKDRPVPTVRRTLRRSR